MKIPELSILVFLSGFFFMSCSKEDNEARNVEIENFIYRGMNNIYLYKADVPELANGFFPTAAERNTFFRTFDSPEEFYEGIQIPDDKFSYMTADYVTLENDFRGVSRTTGIDYSLGYIGNSNNLWGIVRYVLPGTSAEAEGVKRGDVFTKVDGVQMTVGNYRELLAGNNFTIDINYLHGSTITPTGKTISLTNSEYTENPILITKTFDLDGLTVGYLMYNSFTATFDDELNVAFAELQGEGINELVLDLRYNGGGSVESAVDLSSMITGQFKGEVFLKQQWNDFYQSAWGPENYIDRFNDKITIDRKTENEREELINSLGLNKLYVLTTGSSASASELVINGLDAYIDVVQIGETTVGKFQASTTLYDSEGLINKDGVNPNHTYAIQPLIYKSANAKGITDFIHGLEPDVEVSEDLGNMGELGNKNEPLLKAALNHIQGIPQDHEEVASSKRTSEKFRIYGERKMHDLNYQRMYTKDIPEVISEN